MIKIKDLTPEEKLRLICGADFWHIVDLDGKLPVVSMSDGPIGVRQVTEMLADGKQISRPSVAYPAIQLLANTWSKDCARRMGECLADDCLDAGVDILLAPGVNIKRNPLNGRNFEYFSEDPLLAGTLACEYISGVQEGGVGTCLKHFCVNNLEYNRLHQTSDVDERTLRELYYRAFELSCKAKPVSVMCAYNRVNGVYASENRKGFAVLRNELGFDGAIISDWGAVRDRTKAALAGLDLEMPFHQGNYDRLVADYQNGKLPDEVLDACAQRVLNLIERVKAMRQGKSAVRSVEERLNVAQEIAEEGMVLLKNTGCLPLRRGTRVAVCGCFAEPQPGDVSGGGSSRVEWLGEKWSIPKLLEAELGTKVHYERAYWPQDIESFTQDPSSAVRNAAMADVNLVCVGTGETLEYEGGDRKTIRLPEVQIRTIHECATIGRTIVVIFAGSAVDTSEWEDEVDAILYAGFPGERGGKALVNILTGKVNPSGRLSETFAKRPERAKKPSCNDASIFACNAYQDSQVTRYQEGLDVGYRYYDRNSEERSYAFGYGLSYSEFVYKDASFEKISALELSVKVSVENLSERDGKETIQIYVAPICPYVYRPEQELKAYQKRTVPAGGSTQFELTLDRDAFAYWSTANDCRQIDDGVYEIRISKNSAEAILTRRIRIVDGEIVE